MSVGSCPVRAAAVLRSSIFVSCAIISQIILKNGFVAAHKQTGLVQGALDILSKYNLHTYMYIHVYSC